MSTSATWDITQYQYTTSGDPRTEDGKISILEKINRLTQLHDADLAPEEFLQRYANNLGYNVDVTRGEFGDTAGNTLDDERYLRFMLRNLPTWYKIKTTKRSIKTLLFSFGLVGDIVYWYTKEYDEIESTEWRLSTYTTRDGKIIENVSDIPDEYYPTTHFMVWYNLLKSRFSDGFAEDKMTQIANAINSIRPGNTVFTGIGAVLECQDILSMNTISEIKSDIVLISDGYADAGYTAP